jgi:hypothetical protein
MLKLMRKNTKMIIWTVIVSFALWGAYSVGTGFQKEGRLAGEVFGKGVSFQEFNRFYRASQIFSFTGKPVQDPGLIKQQTWQSILYSREAKQRGIQVTDDEVRTEVERILHGQGIEPITPEIYQRWLRSTVQESAKDFEQEVRELLRIQKLLLQVHNQPMNSPSREDALKKFLGESKGLTEKDFNKEMEEKYTKELTEEKQYEQFIEWNLKLSERAHLKDYLPRSENGEVPAS